MRAYHPHHQADYRQYPTGRRSSARACASSRPPTASPRLPKRPKKSVSARGAISRKPLPNSFMERAWANVESNPSSTKATNGPTANQNQKKMGFRK